MNIGGDIIALDLATNCGYAYGGPRAAAPISGSIRLKSSGEDRGSAFAALTRFLLVKIADRRPVLLAKEAPFRLQAFLERSNSEDSVRLQIGLHAIVEGVASSYKIPVVDIAAAKVRKHFIGQSSAGNRAATKLAVIKRCRLLGYMPKNCADDNRADAIATWSCARGLYRLDQIGGGKLMMFGEETNL